MDLLLLRTVFTSLTFIVALVVYFWSRRKPSLFIGLYALNVLLIRIALVYEWLERDCNTFEIMLTLPQIWILLAVSYIAKSIYEQKNP